MKTSLLREKFLNFFRAKKHKIVESDSLVPKDDPTVLFTPAGMNQFKKEFLGFDSGFRRATSAQRCLRTDDLEKVGKTRGHHTFFEMLGNFSFGDYFKKEAISWAWEFLSKELKVNPQALWVSVYRDDDEAYAIWKDLIKVPEEKIIKLGDKENFWPSEAKTKGPNGPCGPCSEIFFDQGKDKGCGKQSCGPSCGCGRFLEVWNLVFTQYNRLESGKLEPLPKKNIDTGMGLERLAAVMQGVNNNFETDLFIPLVQEITAHRTLNPENEKELLYAISDHIRAVVFAIYDGVLPANDGRGYVVRKLIRKSVLHLRVLGITHIFLNTLVPVVAEIMKQPYPELLKRRENIAEVIAAEERNFIATLNSSEQLFKEKFSGFLEAQDAHSVGRLAFVLYDTYGIPQELTCAWLKEKGIVFSQDAFDAQMKEQKVRSKEQSAMKGDVFSSGNLDFKVAETKFLGYEKNLANAKILEILQGNSRVKKISQGQEATIILDKTVLYPEGGGQVADTGQCLKVKAIFEVLDTKKTGKVVLHRGRVKAGTLRKGDEVQVQVDLERRLSIARNHTATHLLQAALRKVLGAHVQQQGSLVADEKLRFDFTHFKALDSEQLGRIEEVVNTSILENIPLQSKEMSLAQARKSGALAFFGEKYEGKVRVVSAGDFSKEFCGGTHLKSTGEIGLFKILQESSIASGVRRIEAVTGNYAFRAVKIDKALIESIVALLHTPRERIMQELESRITRAKTLEKQLHLQKAESVKGSLDALLNEGEVVNGVRVITKTLENISMDLLRKNVDLLKQKTGSCVIALGSTFENKALLVVGVTEDLCQKGMDASKLIREAAIPIGGSGGGRKDFAQAGGSKPENFNQVFGILKGLVEKFS